MGQERNTYFVFSSDNGYHMGEYRLMPGKMTAFDTDIHVPLIVTGPDDLFRENPNYVGGAITGGVADLGQFFARHATRVA